MRRWALIAVGAFVGAGCAALSGLNSLDEVACTDGVCDAGADSAVADDKPNDAALGNDAIPSFDAGPLGPGSLDPSFGGTGIVTTTGLTVINAVVVAPDESIFIAGAAGTGAAVAHLTPAGALDPGFGTAGVASVQDKSVANALILVGQSLVVGASAGSGELVVARISAINGALDPTFTGDGIKTIATPGAIQASSIGLAASNKIVVAGTEGASPTHVVEARLSSNGSLDALFGDAGVFVTAGFQYQSANALFVDSDDSTYLVGAQSNTPSSATHALVVNVSTSGVETTSGTLNFPSSPPTTAYALTRVSSGDLIGACTLTTATSTHAVGLLAYTPGVGADTTFANQGFATPTIGTDATAKAISVDAIDRLLVGGAATGADAGVSAPYVARFSSAGALDTAFGSGGTTILTSLGAGETHGVAIAIGGGNIVFAGAAASGPFVARVLP